VLALRGSGSTLPVRPVPTRISGIGASGRLDASRDWVAPALELFPQPACETACTAGRMSVQKEDRGFLLRSVA
jgi:hypothetical protein